MIKGLTPKVEAIIADVAGLECIKPYILCGGTALAIQLGHRKSEDLDFMMWRQSPSEKPEVDWPAISDELKSAVGAVERIDMLGFDQVEFTIGGVKLSFYVSDNYEPEMSPVPFMGNIRLADPEAILAMKMEVMLRRAKFRDYYDIYSILRAGYSIREGIDKALSYSRHRLSRKNLIAMLLSARFVQERNFPSLEPIYHVSATQIREYILTKLRG